MDVLLHISQFLKLDVWEILSQRNVRCARVCADTQLFSRKKAASQEICLSFIIDLEVHLRFWIWMVTVHFNAKCSVWSAVGLVSKSLTLVVAKLKPETYLIKDNKKCSHQHDGKRKLRQFDQGNFSDMYLKTDAEPSQRFASKNNLASESLIRGKGITSPHYSLGFVRPSTARAV